MGTERDRFEDAIRKLVAKSGDFSIPELSAELGMSDNGVRHHLDPLIQAGVVKVVHAGKPKRYGPGPNGSRLAGNPAPHPPRWQIGSVLRIRSETVLPECNNFSVQGWLGTARQVHSTPAGYVYGVEVEGWRRDRVPAEYWKWTATLGLPPGILLLPEERLDGSHKW